MLEIPKNLSVLGVFVEEEYYNTEYVQDLIGKIKEDVLVVFPFMTREDTRVRNEVLLKTDNKVRYWELDEFEKNRLSYDKQEVLSDHMFLSYLKYFQGASSKLFIFPREWGDPNSLTYSSRVQSLIIKAHLLDIRYQVVREGSLDAIRNSKAEDDLETDH